MRYIFYLIFFLLLLTSCQQKPITEQGNTFQLTNVSNESNVNESERYIIAFKKNKDLSLVRRQGGKVVREMKNLPIVASKISEQAKKALEKNPNIQFVEKDKRVELISEAEDWGFKKINSYLAWEYPYSGDGIKVAVADTGIEINHEDLNLAGGVSFVEESNGDSSFNDYNGHGTHVAGIISAKHNGIGAQGVAPGVDLFSVKVLNQEGDGYLSDVIAGIDWAVTNEMDILNLSLGMDVHSDALEKAINSAYQAGVLVIAAAGNSGDSYGTGDNVNYPARLENVIAVSAITKDNVRAEFSSTGSAVELAAPGEGIYSTYLNSDYEYLSGTSMAAPFVAGIAALLKESHPDWSNAQLRTYLQESVYDLGEIGRDSSYGYGLIQFSLPQSIPQKNSPPSLEQPTLQSTQSNENFITLRWKPVENADFYRVKRGEQILYYGEETEFIDYNLEPGERYQYEITAINEIGSSEKLIVDEVTKMRNPSLQYTMIDEQTIQLQWTELKEAVEYRLMRNGEQIYTGKTAIYMDRNLAYNTSFDYELIAIGKAGTSKSNNVTITTNNRIPPKPLNVNVEASNRLVTVQWSRLDEKDIAGYYIYVNGNRYNKQRVLTNKVELSNLINGKTYSLTVTSVTSAGVESAHSVRLEATPKLSVKFRDINVHWARHEIQIIGERGWMKGTSIDTFSPNKGLTRAEAAVIMVRALQLKPLQRENIQFHDVNEKHWARYEIEIIAEHGIMTGKGGGGFAPADILTREQMAAMLHRMFLKEKTVPTRPFFSDVYPQKWSFMAVQATNHYKLFYGYEDGTFKPEDELTRGQMAVLMNRISPYFF